MNISDLITNVAILFLMMIPGIILKKCKLIGDGFGKGISNLVLYIAQPCLIFLAYVREFDKSVLIGSLWVLLFSLIAHVVFSVVAFLMFKKAPDCARRMLRFATIFSNAAFMGIPLIAAVIESPSALIYASVYNITFNLFLWTLGVYICTGERDLDNDGDVDADDHKIQKKHSEASLKKALLHPVTLAAALGLVFFLSPLDAYLTKATVIMDGLEMLKNLVAPLSMIVIGIRLADIDFRGFFTDKNLYIFLALRHLLLPLAVAGLCRLLTLTGWMDENVYLVTVIMASAPAASSATMFAEKYDCDAAYVSKLVSLSTILSIATMPLVLLIATL